MPSPLPAPASACLSVAFTARGTLFTLPSQTGRKQQAQKGHPFLKINTWYPFITKEISKELPRTLLL